MMPCHQFALLHGALLPFTTTSILRGSGYAYARSSEAVAQNAWICSRLRAARGHCEAKEELVLLEERPTDVIVEHDREGVVHNVNAQSQVRIRLTLSDRHDEEANEEGQRVLIPEGVQINTSGNQCQVVYRMLQLSSPWIFSTCSSVSLDPGGVW